jgi:hypothetical protein
MPKTADMLAHFKIELLLIDCGARLTSEEKPAGACNHTDGETNAEVLEDATWTGRSVVSNLGLSYHGLFYNKYYVVEICVAEFI